MKYQLFAFLVLCFLFFSATVFAKTTTSFVNATIQISVCGNNDIEGGEDCEGSNLNGKSCVSLGYASGTLSCDISCGFDTSKCVLPTPTPTLIPTTTPIPGASTTTINNVTNTPIPSPTPQKQQRQNTAVINKPPQLFPPALQVLTNNTGTIPLAQLHTVLSVWVSGWKQTTAKSTNKTTSKAIAANSCDVNHDGICDARDLSMLLYYVRK